LAQSNSGGGLLKKDGWDGDQHKELQMAELWDRLADQQEHATDLKNSVADGQACRLTKRLFCGASNVSMLHSFFW